MNQPVTRFYYTYQELLDQVSIPDYQMPRYPHDVEMSQDWFTKLIEAGDLEFAVYALSEFFTDSLINDIVNALMGVVYNRHANDIICWVDNPEDEQSGLEDAMYKALIKIIGVIDLTLPRYIPLLQQNEYASTDPIAPVSSISKNKTRFNDTPQDGGDFNNDPHATNVSESENETSVDSASLMERLDQLFKNFRSIILEWSNEFNQLFFKEEQIV